MPRLVALSMVLCCLPLMLSAEEYPLPADPYVTDIAGIISAGAEVRLRTELKSLKEETGIEAAVVTIPTRKAYEPPSDSLESFATGLFNSWGIGDAQRNDGLLLLVIPGDRETRLELGAGYDQGYDVLAQDIVNRWLEPAFRDGEYSDGIEMGMQAAVDRVARRHHARLAPQALPARPSETEEHLGSWIVGILFTAIAGFAIFGRKLGDLAAGLRRCPQCGRRHLRRSRSTLVHAGPGTPGTARIVTECGSCGYRDEREERIGAARRRNRGGGSFGGGRSSGGGASGRW